MFGHQPELYRCEAGVVGGIIAFRAYNEALFPFDNLVGKHSTLPE
jgi:hypothetical protein